MEVYESAIAEMASSNGLAGKRMDYLSFAEAAEYLGKHEQTLEYYQKRGWLKPDRVYMDDRDESKGRTRVYTKESLDRFRDTYLKRDSELPTFREVAERYVSAEGNPLTLATVYFQIRRRRKIEPVGKRGNLLTFAPEDIEEVAREEGWIDLADIQEKIKSSELGVEDVLDLIRKSRGRHP